MERWYGKVAVVTRAASNIGMAISKTLVEHGFIVIGLSTIFVESMMNQIKHVKGPGKFYARQMNITNQQEVESTLGWVKQNFGSVNILVNNGGYIADYELPVLGNYEITAMASVNFRGLVYCSVIASKLMKFSDPSEIRILNINSDIQQRLTAQSIQYSDSLYKQFAMSVRYWVHNEDMQTLTRTPITDITRIPYAVRMGQDKLRAEDVCDTIIRVLHQPISIQLPDIVWIEPQYPSDK